MSDFFDTHHRSLVVVLLMLMLALGIGSMVGDAGIVDEVAHIPAGYSYLKYGDFRLNPEHPPLLKDIAAFPLLFLDLKFPDDIPAWTTEPNGQWETGWHFIYHVGNDADAVLFWSRLPILLLALAFGYFVYRFCAKRYGRGVGLLALFFFTLSPNLIAHSRLVTTDLGIAAFIFFSLYTFFNWIEKPTGRNLWWATLFFALMQLAKFSAVIMVPFYILLVGIAVVAWQNPETFGRRLIRYGGGLAVIFVGGLLITWLVYVPHTWNMPLDVQDRLIADSLKWGLGQKVANILIAMNDLPLMKSLVQYILGVAMVFNRVQGGNTTYFLGQVTNQSFAMYFPVSYLIKTPITELFLILVALVGVLVRYLRGAPFRVWKNFLQYARENYVELSLLLFVLYYAYLSITGNLNLGIRHLFPMFPVIFVVIAKETLDFIKKNPIGVKRTAYIGTLGVLLAWYACSNFSIYPNYIAYFNEIVGGPANAYKYVSDSNVDWGQDLKRLANYVAVNPQIDKIAVDYFGGGDPKYYFCERKTDDAGNLVATPDGYNCDNSKFLPWHAEWGRPPAKYLAVSETFLMNDLWWAPLREDGGYAWLREMEPVAKIGYSIYVYRVP